MKKLFLFFCLFLNFTHTSAQAPLHDPTAPVTNRLSNKPSFKIDDFNLQSIIIGHRRRLAMINGQLVGTGSKIQGARVLAIDKNHVVLFHDGQRKNLYLFSKRLWNTR